MIRLNIWLTVNDPQDVADVSRHLAEAARLSREEPGCVRFEVYHSQTNPRQFLLHEWWESPASLDVHRTARAYNEFYKPFVLPRVTREAHPSELVEG